MQTEYRVNYRLGTHGPNKGLPTYYVIERRLSKSWIDGNIRCVENARGGVRKFFTETAAMRAMRKLTA